MAEEYDDHYWDIIAQRQLTNLVDWLSDFTDPEFRVRIWQNTNWPGATYEESMTQFFDDFSLEWLLEDGLARLGMDESVVTRIKEFAERFDVFDKTLPKWVDPKALEANAGFHTILAHAARLLRAIKTERPNLRTVVDDI